MTVSDREWSWPAAEDGGDAGAALDGCYGPTDWGLREGPSGCGGLFFDPAAAEVKQVTGPWGRGYYVKRPLEDSEPSVRWGLTPVLRQGADLQYPTATVPADVRRNCRARASVYEVNMACSKNAGRHDASEDFGELIDAWRRVPTP